MLTLIFRDRQRSHAWPALRGFLRSWSPGIRGSSASGWIADIFSNLDSFSVLHLVSGVRSCSPFSSSLSRFWGLLYFLGSMSKVLEYFSFIYSCEFVTGLERRDVVTLTNLIYDSTEWTLLWQPSPLSLLGLPVRLQSSHNHAGATGIITKTDSVSISHLNRNKRSRRIFITSLLYPTWKTYVRNSIMDPDIGIT